MEKKKSMIVIVSMVVIQVFVFGGGLFMSGVGLMRFFSWRVIYIILAGTGLILSGMMYWETKP